MSHSVLIVDDSLLAIRTAAKLLAEIPGYRVVGEAQNGAQAVALFKTQRPDVVLLDVIMPMMDGLETLRTLMQIDPRARVIIFSSIGGKADVVEQALRLGASQVLSKPFGAAQLRGALDRLFSKEQAHD